MKRHLTVVDGLTIATIVLMLITTITGLCAFDTSNSYEVVNQYGDTVQMWGSGIYRHDSYFRAPILIGTDCTMLVVTIPLLVTGLVQEMKKRTARTKLFLASVMAAVVYYSASAALGVTYNALHLIYIALFSCSSFALIGLLTNVDQETIMQHQSWNLPTKGVSIFLILSGLSLLVAWMPDIIATLFTGRSLSLIEVYTTEVTNVLDIGIISPLLFICLYQLRHNHAFGHVLLSVLLVVCSIVGVMVTSQSIFQIAAHVAVPVPALITKAGTFVVLSLVSFALGRTFYKELRI